MSVSRWRRQERGFLALRVLGLGMGFRVEGCEALGVFVLGLKANSGFGLA